MESASSSSSDQDIVERRLSDQVQTAQSQSPPSSVQGSTSIHSSDDPTRKEGHGVDPSVVVSPIRNGASCGHGEEGCSSHTGSEEDMEAGLDLLFAASLLRQTGNSQASAAVTGEGTDERRRAVGLETLQQPQLSKRAEDKLNGGSVSSFGHLDILLGRGGSVNKNVGNVIFRRIVDYNKERYRQVPKRRRVLVSESIVQAILHHGGRFLQLTGSEKQERRPRGQRGDDDEEENAKVGGWTEVPYKRAVQKTSQALRERNQEERGSSDIGSPRSSETAATTVVPQAQEQSNGGNSSHPVEAS